MNKQWRLLTVLSFLFALAALPAWAGLDLQAARSQGLVGEKADGYVSGLKNSPDVTALVAEVNARRKAEYASISKKNGQSVDVVAKLAAEEIINKLAPGASYQGPDGSWKKR